MLSFAFKLLLCFLLNLFIWFVVLSDTRYLSRNGEDEADCGRTAQTPCRTFRELWNQFAQAPLSPGDNTVSERFQVRSLDIVSDTDIEIKHIHLAPNLNNFDTYYVKLISAANKIIHINILNVTISEVYLIFNGSMTSLFVQDCQFYGSGFQVSSEITEPGGLVILKNCSFSGDVIKSAVQVTNMGNASMDSCTFSNLKSLELNSAFECLNSDVRITNSSFLNYTVSYEAFLVLDRCNVTATNLQVSGIQAFSTDNALHAIIAETSQLRVEYSLFAHNYLSNGGLLVATESTLTVENSSFHHNSMAWRGIVSITKTQGILRYCEFVNNTGVDTTVSYDGNIVITSSANLIIDNCRFHNNTYYMPIHTRANTHAVINHSHFSVNLGDDVVRVAQGKLKISNSYFRNNSNSHTVIACYHGDVSLENVNVSKNLPITLRMSDCIGYIDSSQFMVTIFSLVQSNIAVVNSSWFHDRAGNSAMMWVTASNISFTRCIFSPLNVGEKLGSVFEILDENRPPSSS